MRGKNRRRTDERAGKPDNINFIHCLCPVIREGEKKTGEVDVWAELRTLMSKLTFSIGCFSIGFAILILILYIKW